jgi:hypothetical protein
MFKIEPGRENRSGDDSAGGESDFVGVGAAAALVCAGAASAWTLPSAASKKARWAARAASLDRSA